MRSIYFFHQHYAAFQAYQSQLISDNLNIHINGLIFLHVSYNSESIYSPLHRRNIIQLFFLSICLIDLYPDSQPSKYNHFFFFTQSWILSKLLI
jgi:hypothetical protein